MDIKVYELILNLPQLRVKSAEISDKTIHFYCSTKSGFSVCPLSGSESTKVNEYTQR